MRNTPCTVRRWRRLTMPENILSTFSRWTVLTWARSCKCRCECGRVRHVSRNHLLSGKSRSCGCLRIELQRGHARFFKHGHSRIRNGKPSSEYQAWIDMRRRCQDPTHKFFYRYGARGIKVCKRWMKFENFLKDMGLKPSADLTLDRIKNDHGYSPKNCRWATRQVQASNRSFVKNGDKTTIAVRVF